VCVQLGISHHYAPCLRNIGGSSAAIYGNRFQARDCPLTRIEFTTSASAFEQRENDMSIITGYDKLASVPEEQVNDKIGRRVISGKQGMLVYWRIKAGAHAGAHKHPHEQFVWMLKGRAEFRLDTEKRTVKPGDILVIPGGVEHEAHFPEDTEVIDFFAPVREDFLTGEPPSYMAQR
jgi:quercetin dioxygenase-like cupin family protein